MKWRTVLFWILCKNVPVPICHLPCLPTLPLRKLYFSLSRDTPIFSPHEPLLPYIFSLHWFYPFDFNGFPILFLFHLFSSFFNFHTFPNCTFFLLDRGGIQNTHITYTTVHLQVDFCLILSFYLNNSRLQNFTIYWDLRGRETKVAKLPTLRKL